MAHRLIGTYMYSILVPVLSDTVKKHEINDTPNFIYFTLIYAQIKTFIMYAVF